MNHTEYSDEVNRANRNPKSMLSLSESSRSWLQNKTTGIKDFFKRGMKRRPKNLTDLDYVDRKSAKPGELVMFVYNPKWKKKLPYYDKFPLAMIIGPAKGGFYGLNFHYLPIRYRAQLFDAYITHGKKANKLPWQRRVLVTYVMLKSISKLKYYKPCLKHYLFTHVKSPYSVVKRAEWRDALFIPTAKWEKSSEKEIWKDSLDIV